MDYIIEDVKNENYEMFENSFAYGEERRLQNKIYEYLPHIDIYRAEKLSNPYLYAAFLLKQIQLEDCEVVEMIHATAACNVPSIASDNLNWRYVERAKYGYGVSFSFNADYADFHSTKQGGKERAFIICDVLMRKKKKVIDNKHQCPSRPNIDTYVSRNGFVYLKFEDFTFYPKYALFYDRPPKCLSSFYTPR